MLLSAQWHSWWSYEKHYNFEQYLQQVSPLVKYKKQIFPRWTVVDCFKAMFTCYGSAVRSECVKAEEGLSCTLPLLVCKDPDLMAKYPCVLDAYRLDYTRQMPSPVDMDAQLPALLWEKRTGLMEDLPPRVSAQLQRWPASGAVGSLPWNTALQGRLDIWRQHTEMQNLALILVIIIGNHNIPPSGILASQNG